MSKFFLLFLSFILLYCNFRKSVPMPDKILIDGSRTMYPITKALVDQYLKTKVGKKEKSNIILNKSETGKGFEDFCSGKINIVNASRAINSDESNICSNNFVDYMSFIVAYDALLPVTHKDLAIKKISIKRLRELFQADSKAYTWNQISPKFPKVPIKLFIPPVNSGTYSFLMDTILGPNVKARTDIVTYMEDTNRRLTYVRETPGSFTMIPLASSFHIKEYFNIVPVINPITKKIVSPSMETIHDGEYQPFSRYLFIYVNANVNTSESLKKRMTSFLTYYLANMSEVTVNAHSIPITANELKEEKEKLKRLFNKI